LGRPSDIDNESPKEDSYVKIDRKIYRDPENRIIGGVCSGLSAYMGIDVVWVRIIFILLMLAVSVSERIINRIFDFDINALGLFIIIYCVLWIIIPKAKTVAQKCAMRGESQDLSNIQKKYYESTRKLQNTSENNSWLSRFVKVIIGLLLLTIGIGGIITGFVLFFGLGLFGGFSLINIVDYIQLNINPSWILKVLCLLVYYLPFIGMLYAGIQLCFGFRSPKFKPGLIIFIVWVISVIIFCFLGTKSLIPYMGHSEDIVSNNLTKVYDTVYVKYANPKNKVNISNKLSRNIKNINRHNDDYYNDYGYGHESVWFYSKAEDGNFEFIYYPDIDIDYSDNSYQDTLDKKEYDNYVECKMQNLSNEGAWGLINYDSFNLSELNNIYEIKDSLIVINPQIISKKKKFNGKLYSIDIVVPEKTKVIIDNPYRKIK
jgi:Putative stress-responsive transcriptional regulator